MPVIKRIVYLFLFTFLSLSLHAEETTDTGSKEKQYYIVEIILFEHLNEEGKNDEFWSRPEVFNTDSMNHIDISPSDKQLTDDSPALAEYNINHRSFRPLTNGIAELSKENYKLSDSAGHLRYSKNYKLLAHFGWTQRALSKNRSLPIRLTTNQFASNLTPKGELKLYVSRYLHLQVDLNAAQCTITEQTPDPDNSINSTECVKQNYLFKQNRKMRSRELHYLDNPIFGLLVYITPFKA